MALPGKMNFDTVALLLDFDAPKLLGNEASDLVVSVDNKP